VLFVVTFVAVVELVWVVLIPAAVLMLNIETETEHWVPVCHEVLSHIESSLNTRLARVLSDVNDANEHCQQIG
jgi:hypothetical protein